MGVRVPNAPGVKKVPFGEGWLVMGNVTPLGISAADDWVAAATLGLTRILSAIASTGQTGAATRVSVQLNAQGTGVGEGVNLGDLGFETSAFSSTTVNFIVYGIGPRRAV